MSCHANRSGVWAIFLCVVATVAPPCCADIIYDFSAAPVSWDPLNGPLTWDANGDSVHDLQLSVVSGLFDPNTGRYVIDNFSTSSGGATKSLLFAVSALDPMLSSPTFNNFGFSLYAQKTIEPGGSGGAGSVSIAAFDDLNAELVGGVNISGSLNSNPHSVAVAGQVSTTWFTLTIDPSAPPNNNHAQVILGRFIFNSGTVQFFTTAVPEPGCGWLVLCGLALCFRRNRRN